MKGLRIVLLAAALFMAFAAAFVWRDRHNTLASYPEWKSRKAELGLGVNGAHSFLQTPISLLGRALNLGAWHSQHELRLEKDWDELPEIKLRLFAEGESEWTLFARSGHEGAGFALRLSNRPGRPSAWLRTNSERLVQQRHLIPFSLPRGRWLEISLRRAEARVEAFAGTERLGSFDRGPGPWKLSFHGHSSTGVLRIDDLELTGHGGPYLQSFSDSFPWWLFVLVAGALIGFLLVVEDKLNTPLAFAIGIGGALFAGLVLNFYDSRIGNQYPRTVDLHGQYSHIELRDQALQRLKGLRGGPPVLLWLGGSQAWGAGADSESSSAFARLKAKLDTSALEFVNGAISAATLEDQLEVLRIVSSRRNLSVVVLTVGVNDANNDSFVTKLGLLETAVRQRKAKLLLVPEPTDNPVAPLVSKRQEEMRVFAREKELPMVDLPTLLDAGRDKGYLWWDFVHLSNAGAALVAEALEPPLRALISGERPVEKTVVKKELKSSKSTKNSKSAKKKIPAKGQHHR